MYAYPTFDLLPYSNSLSGFVYRFITTGTIEEKIFQRQASKQALSSAVVDENENTERHFSIDALRKLFLLNDNTLCETHETFKCKRCTDGKQTVKSPALLYGDASTQVLSVWHY
jgi:DNA repair and recombination RAD54-like protein